MGRSMRVSVIAKRRVFDRFFKIDEAELRYEKFNGQMSEVVKRLSFERGDSVAAIIFNRDTRKLIFVNQFKYPCYEKGPGWITETMAGMVAPGEDVMVALRREVLEETGYRVGDATHIATFYVSPGGSSERISLWYVEVSAADQVQSGGGLAQEGEDIKLVEMDIDALEAAIVEGAIVDAKTLVGLMWLSRRLNR
jgi:nudix-type nucleoside diphosphatase (YffH/AdpP family)